MTPATTRRDFLAHGATIGGVAALAALLGRDAAAGSRTRALQATHRQPRARRVIQLTQSGAPSQIDLFDPKPDLTSRFGEALPDSVRMGQRVTTMTASQAQLVLPSQFAFRRSGECGMELSELVPHLGRIADRICLVRSMVTEQINHAPAMTLCQTGHERPGRPSAGAWLSYGLGSENDDLPTYVVMLSRDIARTCGQPLYDHLWGSGFLPSEHQGVKLRAGRDPVLYLTNPEGIDRRIRRDQLDDLAALNRHHQRQAGDPEIEARVAQYELAFRMQASVPDLVDFSDEPEETFRLYGERARVPGSYAANCLLARRLIERGVRFVQLFHVGWDQHNHLPEQLRVQCQHTDQASAALVIDLERRGLLDDTVVVWGGEFGRSVVGQGDIRSPIYGRDHHPRCYSMWLAGGGARRGHVHGVTDDFSFNVVSDPVHVHDLQATLLHLLGIDHERLTFRYQGRDHRLTDVAGQVAQGLLAT